MAARGTDAHALRQRLRLAFAVRQTILTQNKWYENGLALKPARARLLGQMAARGAVICSHYE